MRGLDAAMELYRTLGGLLIHLLLVIGAALGMCTLLQVKRSRGRPWRFAHGLMVTILALLIAGAGFVIWFHTAIYRDVALLLPEDLAARVNYWLTAANARSFYALPLYDPEAPLRHVLPFWMEKEKYLFWSLSFAAMALIAWRRLAQAPFRLLLQGLLCVQVAAFCLAGNPFADPLERFFEEIGPWFAPLAPGARLGLFMKLYPRLLFYYNADYMWFHPPLLFLAYAALTVFFAGCVAMLWTKELACEELAYSFAKPGYLFLTVGMLLGYPWALQAWGPNWWWAPKIASSIMMWVVFSTYLHARLYRTRRGMRGFAGGLGVLCFGAMLFTFLASFFFPGEHTVH